MAVVLTVLAFIWWWPVGLLALGFFIARRRYARGELYAGEGPMLGLNHRVDRWERKMARAQQKVERVRGMMQRYSGGGGNGWFAAPSSGNHAFDAYREETLKRLEDEQHEFKDFLERLRLAKDRAEFDQFMAARRKTYDAPPAPEPPPAAPQA
jgi:hypothetical protein